MDCKLYDCIKDAEAAKKQPFLLYGDGGIGKSTQMKQLAACIIEKEKNSIPIFVDIKKLRFSSDMPLFTYICEEYCGSVSDPQKVKELFVDNNAPAFSNEYIYWLLIDGLNEQLNKHGLLNDIKILQNCRRVKIVISSRTDETKSVDCDFTGFQKIRLKPLSNQSVYTILKDQFGAENINAEEINPDLIEILSVPLYLNTFLRTNRNSIPNLYTKKGITKTDLLNAFINKIKTDQATKFSALINNTQGEAPVSEKDVIRFIISYFLPALAFQFVKSGVMVLSTEQFETFAVELEDYFKKRMFSLERADEFATMMRVVKNLDAIEILAYTKKFVAVLDIEDGNLTFSHQIWLDFFCAKHIENIILKYYIFDELKYTVTEDIRLFAGELLGEYKFSEKADAKSAMSPLEAFMQKHNLTSKHKLSPTETKNIVEIMKTSRNNCITGDYSNLDLTECDFSDSNINHSNFSNSKISEESFLTMKTVPNVAPYEELQFINNDSDLLASSKSCIHLFNVNDLSLIKDLTEDIGNNTWFEFVRCLDDKMVIAVDHENIVYGWGLNGTLKFKNSKFKSDGRGDWLLFNDFVMFQDDIFGYAYDTASIKIYSLNSGQCHQSIPVSKDRKGCVISKKGTYIAYMDNDGVCIHKIDQNRMYSETKRIITEEKIYTDVYDEIDTTYITISEVCFSLDETQLAVKFSFVEKKDVVECANIFRSSNNPFDTLKASVLIHSGIKKYFINNLQEEGSFYSGSDADIDFMTDYYIKRYRDNQRIELYNNKSLINAINIEQAMYPIIYIKGSNAVTFSSDGKMSAVADLRVGALSIIKGKERHIKRIPSKNIYVDYSPSNDFNYIACGSVSGNIGVYSIRKKKLEYEHFNAGSFFRDMHFNPNNNEIVILPDTGMEFYYSNGDYITTITTYNLQTKKRSRITFGYNDILTCISFSDDAKMCLLGGLIRMTIIQKNENEWKEIARSISSHFPAYLSDRGHYIGYADHNPERITVTKSDFTKIMEFADENGAVISQIQISEKQNKLAIVTFRDDSLLLITVPFMSLEHGRTYSMDYEMIKSIGGETYSLKSFNRVYPSKDLTAALAVRVNSELLSVTKINLEMENTEAARTTYKFTFTENLSDLRHRFLELKISDVQMTNSGKHMLIISQYGIDILTVEGNEIVAFENIPPFEQFNVFDADFSNVATELSPDFYKTLYQNGAIVPEEHIPEELDL